MMQPKNDFDNKSNNNADINVNEISTPPLPYRRTAAPPRSPSENKCKHVFFFITKQISYPFETHINPLLLSVLTETWSL